MHISIRCTRSSSQRRSQKKKAIIIQECIYRKKQEWNSKKKNHHHAGKKLSSIYINVAQKIFCHSVPSNWLKGQEKTLKVTQKLP